MGESTPLCFFLRSSVRRRPQQPSRTAQCSPRPSARHTACRSQTPRLAALFGVSWSGQCWSRYSLFLWAVLEQVFTVPLGSAGAGVPLGSAEQVFAGHLGSAGTGFHWSSGQCWSGVRWSSGRAGACCLFTSHLGSAGASCSLVIWAVLEQVICSLVIRQR